MAVCWSTRPIQLLAYERSGAAAFRQGVGVRLPDDEFDRTRRES